MDGSEDVSTFFFSSFDSHAAASHVKQFFVDRLIKLFARSVHWRKKSSFSVSFTFIDTFITENHSKDFRQLLFAFCSDHIKLFIFFSEARGASEEKFITGVRFSPSQVKASKVIEKKIFKK